MEIAASNVNRILRSSRAVSNPTCMYTYTQTHTWCFCVATCPSLCEWMINLHRLAKNALLRLLPLWLLLLHHLHAVGLAEHGAGDVNLPELEELNHNLLVQRHELGVGELRDKTIISSQENIVPLQQVFVACKTLNPKPQTLSSKFLPCKGAR
jgi:hypothetical protein